MEGLVYLPIKFQEKLGGRARIEVDEKRGLISSIRSLSITYSNRQSHLYFFWALATSSCRGTLFPNHPRFDCGRRKLSRFILRKKRHSLPMCRFISAEIALIIKIV